LKTLFANGESCGIADNGIKNLVNLERLSTSYNKKITNINHMTNLKILWAHDNNFVVNDESIKHLTNLKKYICLIIQNLKTIQMKLA